MSYWNRNGNNWPNKYNAKNYGEKIEPWINPPNFEDKSQSSNKFYYNNNRNNFFNQDRCRLRERVNNYDNNFRNNRSRGRRSSSAPRTLSDSYNEPNMNWKNRSINNNNFHRTRRNSVCQSVNNSDNESDEIERNSPIKNVKQLKGFKSIFSEIKTIDNNTSNVNESINDLIHVEKNVRSKRIVYEIKDKTINNNATPEKKPDEPIIENIKIKKIQKDIKTKQTNQDITKYFGDSLSDNINTDLKVELPIIDWPKKSFTIDNVPKYNSDNIVGGDGITIELYYMCKYCCMFTYHSQIGNHLKSKYHYDKYIEYLKNGYVVSDNSSMSSTNSSNVSRDDNSSELNNQNLISTKNISKINQFNADVDTSDLLFNVHEELDYNEDTD